jgi:uncharacterized protein YaiI (UPF0178 family)
MWHDADIMIADPTAAIPNRMLPTIFVDADACPVRDEVYRVATRVGLSVHVVANGSRPIRPPGLPNVAMVIVGDSMDAADDWIVEHIRPNDICVTNDIPLAARCLDNRAFALGFTGKIWTAANIGNALAGREISRHMREMGFDSGGGKPMEKADRSRFLSALDNLVVAARRASPA